MWWVDGGWITMEACVDGNAFVPPFCHSNHKFATENTEGTEGTEGTEDTEGAVFAR